MYHYPYNPYHYILLLENKYIKVSGKAVSFMLCPLSVRPVRLFHKQYPQLIKALSIVSLSETTSFYFHQIQSIYRPGFKYVFK